MKKRLWLALFRGPQTNGLKLVGVYFHSFFVLKKGSNKFIIKILRAKYIIPFDIQQIKSSKCAIK